MKVTVTITDALYETLAAITPKGKDVSDTAAGILAAYPLDIRERHLVVSAEERKSIEKILNASIPTTKELLKRIENHASVKIGNIRLTPTTAQMKKLETRAANNHRTPEEEANIIFQQIAPNFFGYV